MPRRARVIFPGLSCHVTQRGNNRQQLFFAPENYQYYLELLAGHARRCGVQVLGYCLMPNHVHLIATPDSIGYFGRWDYGEWKELLLEGGAAEADEAIRRATRTGEPLGSREFVAGLERRAGRRLRVLERGRPKQVAQSPEERARQGCLFQGGGE